MWQSFKTAGQLTNEGDKQAVRESNFSLGFTKAVFMQAPIYNQCAF